MKPIPHTVQLYHLNSNMKAEQRYRIEVMHDILIKSLSNDEFIDSIKPTKKTLSNNLSAWASSSEWLVKEGNYYYRRVPECPYNKSRLWILDKLRVGKSWLM